MSNEKMAETTAVTVRDESRGALLSVKQVKTQMDQVQELMRDVMEQDEDFGVIPGTGKSKPTLLKPGAEKLCLMFRLAPDPESVDVRDGDHLTVKTKCTLYHIPTGQKMGAGEGSCSTKESKYAFRDANRKCPQCGKDAIIKGREDYGGGWLCFIKKGGCNAKWKDGATEIEGQKVGKVPNEFLADLYNTVLKMSNKRALVAAVLNVTAASAIFTQDMEDQSQPEPKPAAATKPAEAQNGTTKAAGDSTPAIAMGTEGRLVFVPKEVKAFTTNGGKAQVFSYALIFTPEGVPIETKSITDTNIAMEARRDSEEITIDYVKSDNGFQVKHLIATHRGAAVNE